MAPDELRDATELRPSLPEVSEQEMNLAVQLVQALASDVVDLSEYRDEHREALGNLIEAKASGETIEYFPIEAPAPTDDVLAGLMASVEAAKAAREG